jgi:probable H4MPT-linked C1 transfer pathway protein
MAVAQLVPFRGAWTPVMNEYFASMADVYRVLGTLPDEIDRHPAADGREKTPAASTARLARMIGRDAVEASEEEWCNLAAWFAEAQLRYLHDAAMQVLSAAKLPPGCPVVAAGSGRFVIAALAARLRRPCEPWDNLVPADPRVGHLIGDCAPAVAVGLLLEEH